MREEIRELQLKLNLTVAYVTHDQEEALAVSDKIIVMSNARIAQRGTPRELYDEPANLFVADFIGDANIVAAELVTPNGDRGQVRLGPVALDLPRRGAVAGPIKLAIRPDAPIVSTAAVPGALEGRVAKAAYLGRQREYTVTTPVGDLFIVERGRAEARAVGSPVWLSFGDDGIVVLPAEG